MDADMMKRARIAFTTLALGLGIGGLLLAVAPANAQVACGDTITGRAKLTGDLLCDSDPALTLEGGASLNMKGHTVACMDDADTGIELTGRKARLTNGTVTGCSIGVELLDEGHHYVSRITSKGNGGEGFSMGSPNNTLFRNRAEDNGHEGFEVNHLEHNRVVGNISTENDEEGIILRGSFSIVIGNRVFDNREEGLLINDTSDENRVLGNRFQNNGENGIEMQNGSDNNVVIGNRAFGNGTEADEFDLLDQNPDCGSNVWRLNRFGTASQACIR